MAGLLRRTLLVISACALLVLLSCMPYLSKPDDRKDKKIKSEIETALDNIKFGNYDEIGSGADTIKWRREEIIDSLINIIKNEIKNLHLFVKDEVSCPNITTWIAAIDALGDVRAIEAVSLLMNNINLELIRPVPGGSSRSTRPENYPAIVALIKIGKAGSLAALKKLEETDLKELEETDSDIRQFCCYIIKEVEGKYARLIIEARINALKDKDKKAVKNLKESLKVFDNMEPGYFR